MSLINDIKNYKYVGMPFHAVGFPQPVYSHLVASKDGVNWDDLKSYNFGWRDTSLAYINGEFWTCTGTYVNHTKDFETFTQVNCPNMGLKNLWASEFYQDNNGNWWFIYCGSETDVDYSEYKLYASRFYPERYQIDAVRHDITLNASGGYIDPNINYINGYYYLWCSKASTPTQELHLFKSSNVLGPYDEVETNIMSLTNSTGYTWNEAPEMLVVNGKYYLYSDPWNKGQSESDRDVYRAESDDLVAWTNMQRCNADVTMRHFTPLYIADLGSDDNIEDTTPVIPPEPIPTPQPTPDPNIPIGDKTQLTFSLWNGDPNLFYETNLNNFILIQKFINSWNNSSKTNDMYEPISVGLDITNYGVSNRNAYRQFIDNVEKINGFIVRYCEIYRINDDEFVIINPNIPYDTDFNKDSINQYWQSLQQDFNFLIKQSIANNNAESV